MMKFINGKIEEVPYCDANLGITFVHPPNEAVEEMARSNFYGPRTCELPILIRLWRWIRRSGPTLRDRDDAFRKRHGEGKLK